MFHIDTHVYICARTCVHTHTCAHAHTTYWVHFALLMCVCVFRAEQLALDILYGSFSLEETNFLSELSITLFQQPLITYSSSSGVKPHRIFPVYIVRSPGVDIMLVLFKKSYCWDLMGAFSLPCLGNTVWPQARILGSWLLRSFYVFCVFTCARDVEVSLQMY